MAKEKIFVGDVGTALVVQITEDGQALDISAATVKEIHIQSPSGVTAEKTASFVTDGTDGKIQYLTTSGDISEAGRWQIQGYVEGVGSWSGYSEIDEFWAYTPL